MIKEDILNMLKELNFPKDEFYIVGGSSLVMRGIREIAGDLDLCISTELFNNIKGVPFFQTEKASTFL